jgi:hypothetical protein
VVLNPEKRKVGGSTPALTTPSDLPERAGGGHFGCCRGGARLNSVSFALSGRSAFPHTAAGEDRTVSRNEAAVIKTRPGGRPVWFDPADGDASVARGEVVTAPGLALSGEHDCSAIASRGPSSDQRNTLHASQRSGQLKHHGAALARTARSW